MEATFKMTAKTFFGLEDVLADELKKIGALNIEKQRRAVTFEGDMETLYKANLWLRTALTVLVPFSEFRAEDENDLYHKIKKINWSRFLDKNGTMAIDSTVNSNTFTHSRYVSLKVKDAIADHFREKYNVRPSVNLKNPDLRLNVYVNRNDVILSMDSSGNSLHKRGYRIKQREAPINEILAAGMIYMTEWDGKSNFVDAMCGSGTIPIEAAMIALNKAPGMNRSFAFEGWKDHQEDLWEKVKKEAKEKEIHEEEADFTIFASDMSSDAVDAAVENIVEAGVEDFIKIGKKRMENFTPPAGGGVAIFNPPYGERIGENVDQLYKVMGDQFKKSYADYKVWVISSNIPALKKVGLRPSEKIELHNGSLQCKFQKYEMYTGSRKKQ